MLNNADNQPFWGDRFLDYVGYFSNLNQSTLNDGLSPPAKVR